jgi:peptidoglycan/xylan/chitin deacetylase (PgdA/CDA1 family)
LIPAKECVRRALSWAVARAGLSGAWRRLRRTRGTVILYGHRLTGDDEGYLGGLSPEWFEQQLAYLRRHFAPISLEELVCCYEQCDPVANNGVVITFDDGFRDNLTNGLPLLLHHDVPATVFVVTRSISTGELPWPQRLGFVLQHTARDEIQLEPGVEPAPIGTACERSAACQRIKTGLRALSREERDGQIQRYAEELGVSPPQDRMLSWADLQELRHGGVEIGAHTYSHAHLARIPIREAEEEMRRSLTDLREHLGIERPFFCFPAGSVNDELVELARRLGFRGCFQSSHRRRFNRLDTSDQFGLSRLGLPNAPGYVLEAEIDGPFHSLRSLYRR